MGAFSRSKGSREERALVMALRDFGFLNVRRGLCQEEKTGFRPDVLGEYKGQEWSFENKAYYDKFKWLYEFMEELNLRNNGFLNLALSKDSPRISIAYDPISIISPDNFYQLYVLENNKKLERLAKLPQMLKIKGDPSFLVVKNNNKSRLFIRYWK